MHSLAQQISIRAQELAASGRYRDWLHIADMLVIEGFTGARSILDNPLSRANLDRACSLHRATPRPEPATDAEQSDRPRD